MEPGRRQQRPDELFLQKPSTPANVPLPDTPTVGPLRINKNRTPSPPSRSSSTEAAVDGNPYPAPFYGSPTLPANPPYPDDRMRQSPRPSQADPGADRDRNTRTATPNSQASRRPHTRLPYQPATSSRARFEANDPNRPTLSGYSRTPPASLRPGAPAGDRKASTPKPLPESPGPEIPEKDDDDLVQRSSSRPSVPAEAGHVAPSTYQQFYPTPGSSSDSSGWESGSASASGSGSSGPLHGLDPAGVNRLSSTASTSTTRAQRGSPPPPETPAADQGVGGLASRFPPTSNNPNAAAAARANQYAAPLPRQGIMSPIQQPQPQQETRRPWTPTEVPGSNPYGAPTVYQGNTEVPAPTMYQSPPLPAHSPESQPVPKQNSVAQPQFTPHHSHHLENQMQGLSVGEEPPPAYSSVSQPGGPRTGSTSQGYPNDKRMSFAPVPAPIPVAQASSPPEDPSLQRHPAFANDQLVQQTLIPPQATPAQGLAPIQIFPAANTPSPGQNVGPASPPPLPEGWIAHLDQNSGQYYYIHLPTQSTQWEFPKGPTPLNLQEPLSPVSTFAHPLTSPQYGGFGSQSLASPGFPPQQAAYRESMMSMGSTLGSPTVSGFTGPPPSAGVDMYKVQPTNGVYFGPYLRYTNTDLERGLWLGSILLVTDVQQPPTIHLHQSTDLSPNPRQLKANPIYSHQRWIFYRYDVDILMDEQGAKYTYAITSHLGCTRYEFLVAGRYDTSWRFIAHSGNDFAMNVNANERAKVGGLGLMWKDVLQKHVECGGFHAQLGLGGQIYGDRLWKEIPALKQWISMSGKENRKNEPWSAKLEDDVTHAYFHYYTSHFDQPHLREAFAQIPHVLQIDDNDIFDGYGSYPDHIQNSNMFKNIGRIGIDMYLLFQHHTTHEILRNVSNDLDLFTITGNGWHFVKYLGPAVVVVGPDTRSERDPHRVMAGPTYQGLFPKVAVLPPSVQHCIWMIPVPLIYPRLEAAEQLANTVATGKKAVTGTFNMLGRVTSSMAGVVGAKGVVGEGFSTIKKAVGKSGLMSGILSPFGDIDMLDELRDMWTHESKDLERTYMIRTLQGISHNKSLRMTFLSGSVNACGAGLVHDPSKPSDHKTMYQLIASPIVNTPPPSYVLRLLNNNPKQPIYIPLNGKRSHPSNSHTPPPPSDTKEDMMEIFVADVNGSPREMRRLMGRRNYVAMVAYDPEVVQGTFGNVTPGIKGSGRLSLAADFMVQNEGAYAAPVKYGPVIIPSLEYGR